MKRQNVTVYLPDGRAETYPDALDVRLDPTGAGAVMVTGEGWGNLYAPGTWKGVAARVVDETSTT